MLSRDDFQRSISPAPLPENWDLQQWERESAPLFADWEAARLMALLPLLHDRIHSQFRSPDPVSPHIWVFDEQAGGILWRKAVLVISWELSKRGVAPRWQGLEEAPGLCEKWKRALVQDRVLFDLGYLWCNWRKATRPKVKAWRAVMEDGLAFDMATAKRIARRQCSHLKRAGDMRAPAVAQVGCLVLGGAQARLARRRIGRHVARWQAKAEAALARAPLSAEQKAGAALYRARCRMVCEVVREAVRLRADAPFTRWEDAGRLWKAMNLPGSGDPANIRRALKAAGWA